MGAWWRKSRYTVLGGQPANVVVVCAREYAEHPDITTYLIEKSNANWLRCPKCSARLVATLVDGAGPQDGQAFLTEWYCPVGCKLPEAERIQWRGELVFVCVEPKMITATG